MNATTQEAKKNYTAPTVETTIVPPFVLRTVGRMLDAWRRERKAHSKTILLSSVVISKISGGTIPVHAQKAIEELEAHTATLDTETPDIGSASFPMDTLHLRALDRALQDITKEEFRATMTTLDIADHEVELALNDFRASPMKRIFGRYSKAQADGLMALALGKIPSVLSSWDEHRASL